MTLEQVSETNERVLCFPAELLRELGEPSGGFSKDIDRYFFGILKQENISFIDRREAEINEAFKQIIPYQILKNSDRYFVYERGSKGGEDRLRKKRSLGIGGHVNEDDKDHPIYFCPRATFSRGADRERNEEVQIPTEYLWKPLGVIYDNTTTVGRVHFGVASIFEFSNIDNFRVKDEALDSVGWMTLQELKDRFDEFESWSKIVINNLL